MLPILRRALTGLALAVSAASASVAAVPDSLLRLADAHVKAGDYRAAVDYYRAYKTANDSLNRAERTVLERRYEIARKRHEADAQAAADRRRILAISLSSGALAILAAIFGLIYRNRRIRDLLYEERQVARTMIDAEQRERIRIARELHDSIGQMLAAARFQVGELEATTAGSVQERAANTAGLMDRTAAELRSISYNLIPEELGYGLLNAVRAHCEKISTAGALQAFAEIAEPLRQRKFPISFELSLYRIVQDVMTGMIRHSGANIIRIRIEPEQQSMLLTLQDNGRGFDTARITDSEGLGWKNIAARVRLLEGVMQVSSERDQGTQVVIRVPMLS